MRSHIEWLVDELPGLERAGVLDAGGAERVRAHYAAAVPPRRRNWAALVISLIGALLVGGGVILLIAHNWEDLPKAARVALAVGPLLAAQALAWRACGARARERVAYAEPVAGFWSIACGAAIAIVAQIYHLPGDTETFLQIWALAVLPIVYLMDSVFAGLVFLALASGWGGFAMESGHGGSFWLWLIPLAPWIHAQWRGAGASMRAAWALWGLALALGCGVGFSLERSLPGLWIIAYSGLFAGLLGLDTIRAPAARHWAQRPFAVVGGLGMVVLAMMLTYEWPWKEIGWHYFREDRAQGAWQYLDYGLALGWSALGLFFAVRSARRREYLRAAYLLFPLLASVGYLLNSMDAGGVAAAVLFNGWLFIAGLATALSGARSGRLALLNGGLLAAGAVVIARFFDSDMSILFRGVAFIVLGAGLLFSNLHVLRRKGARS